MMQNFLDKMELVKSFFSIFSDEKSIEDFNKKLKEFEFVQPIVFVAYQQYLKDAYYEENIEFSLLHKKVLLVFLMLLIEKLSKGDVCVLLSYDNFFRFFNSDVLGLDKLRANLDDVEDAELINRLKEYSERVDSFVKKDLIPNIPNLVKTNNKIISSDVNDVTPLCVFADKSENYRLYLRSYFHYENTVSDFINSHNAPSEGVDEETLEKYKNALDILFPKSNDNEIEYQKVAAAQSALNRFSVICGGPGTGKTTTVIKLLLLLLSTSSRELKITLCAPTGKAASRMVESITKGITFSSIQENAAKLCEDHASLDAQKLLDLIPTNATTIHKVLGIFPHQETPRFNEHNKLDCDIIVIDEVSMISLSLFSKIIRALPEKTKVIMLGDKDQLNSVQPGSVLADICSQLLKENPVDSVNLNLISKISSYSKEALAKKLDNGSSVVSNNVALLVKSRRFSADSVLGIVANNINAAKTKDDVFSEMAKKNIKNFNSVDELFSSDREVSFFDIKDKKKKNQLAVAKAVANQIVDKYQQKGAYLDLLENKKYIVDKSSASEIFRALDKYRILCALNEGLLGTKVINEEIRTRLQKRLQSKSNKLSNIISPKNKSGDFSLGSVILITRNDRLLGVDNGEVGFVAYDSEENQQKGIVKIFFPSVDGKEARVISPERLNDYDTGFAMTIHKSQGCEYQHVCMVLPLMENPIMTKELIYTGITRAKAEEGAEPRVYIVGDEELFFSSIVKKVKRESGLAHMI